MGIVLDIIIIAIITVTAFLSAKRGFVKTAVELVGFVLASYLAFALSAPLSAFIYGSWIEPGVSSSIAEKIAEAGGSVQTAAIDALPAIIGNNLDKFGVDPTALAASLPDTAQAAAQTLCDNIIGPIVKGIFQSLLSIIIFIVATFVVKLLAKLLNKIFSFSVVGVLNKTLGFVLGAVKGAVFAAIFCAAVVLIASLTGKGFFIFSASAVNSSLTCSLLTGITGMDIFKL